MRSRVADILGQSGISDGIRGIDSVIQRFAPEAQKILAKSRYDWPYRAESRESAEITHDKIGH